MIAIGLAAGGGTDGLLVIYGAVIVAGLVTFFIALYFSRLIRSFPGGTTSRSSSASATTPAGSGSWPRGGP